MSQSIHEDVIKVFFKHLGDGLVLDENGFSEFEVAGMDKKYFVADVVNQNYFLEVFSDNVENPLYVRYAWSDTSSASLFNSEGLPASSFHSENE
jgi:sialate O-acetylesterase